MMTDRQHFCLISDRVRLNALNALRSAPDGYEVTIAEPKRSSAQNAKLWAMLADIANAKPEGRQWTPETWKCAFMHLLGHQVRFGQSLDDSGPFPIGFHSSRLTVKEMADLITCISEYGDRHGVDWRDTRMGGYGEAA
jgi:NinB protein